MNKSKRHSKITGDFGEYFVLYLLSKYGFECARIDYVGIDLYAKDNKTGKTLGISVKTKTLSPKKPTQGIELDSIERAKEASDVFGILPYLAVVFDQEEYITVIMFPIAKIEEFCTTSKTKIRLDLKPQALDKYKTHPEVYYMRLKIEENGFNSKL
ncbi:hypothetical protein [Bacillus rubiinfantis]|uniref:hypothetical protein n=1 Tax=Bacillus rubiinfantis TaxID=1499680 RepID=UPI0005AB5054|nr:hypothetical protein [Bacillus rubiinfantis]